MSRTWLIIAVLTLCRCAFATAAGSERPDPSALDQAAVIAQYAAAAEHGDAHAQYKLAALFHEGHDVPRDLDKAVYWYRKAAERGNADAQYWLCIMHREAIGVARDYGESFYWCRRSAGSGHAGALFAVGQYYFEGLGIGFTRDHVQAYIWFTLASEQGDQDARLMLEALERDMPPLQVAQARRHARQWAANGRSRCSPNNPRARAC